MDAFEAIKKRRSIRRFKDEQVPREVLLKLLEAGRCAPSAANKQPLEYIVVDDEEVVSKVFEQLAWAAYVQPRRDPPAGKRPAAYIIVLVCEDKELGKYGTVDAAAAIENMLISACAEGLGTCWLASVNREKVSKILGIEAGYVINSVVAIGVPDEEPEMEDCVDESIEYYLDDNDRLHVPKRPLTQITHINKFGCRLE